MADIEQIEFTRQRVLSGLRQTTAEASRRQARTQERKRRRHTLATVNFDPESHRLTVHLNTRGACTEAVIVRLLKIPYLEVLPDYLDAAPIQAEVLVNNGRNGFLVRLIRRGYPKRSRVLTNNQKTVYDLATFTFRVPAKPITFGPERRDDAERWNDDLAEYPDVSAGWYDAVANTPLGQPLQPHTLKEVLDVSSDFLIFIDGAEIQLSGLFDGRRMCWLPSKAPMPKYLDDSNSIEVGGPGVRLISLAANPAPRPRRSTDAPRTF